ncbi:zinc metalloprotease HtpX [Candidatus Woesearchaeota archaeon]|nr:zinc metalloprotease HtpX [Candidatus Woesearchaeota archaeon]
MIKNQIKTGVLLAALSGVLLLVGYLIGGYNGLTIALVFAVVLNFTTYWFSDKIVLAMYRAKPLKDAPEIHSIVKEVSKEAGIPRPRVYLIPTQNCNAFATGRNPKNAVVALTAGIMNLLNKEELKGVIAHEISHVKNRDILIQTIAATIAAIISYVAFMARFAMIFGGKDRDGGRGLEMIVLAILTPIIAMLLQLAISRAREYLADESGAKLIKNPKALASALEKLEASNKMHPLKFGNKTTEGMFIVNPFKGNGLFALFMTHPPVKKRVQKLMELKI